MKEIVAMEVFGTPYMTQVEDLPINERGYWTRIAGAEVTAEGLRGASAKERSAWVAEVESENLINI